MMELEKIIDQIRHRQPLLTGHLAVWKNAGPSGQDALMVDPQIAPALAIFLRDDPGLRFDYCSNVTGVDWIEGVPASGGETGSDRKPGAGHLEAVYHLYSVALRHGPLILRLRTGDRDQNVHLPSLASVWKSAELQEREIYDLYGIRFDGHPDLRRLLLWDEFQGHPMRKDFQEPDETPAGTALSLPLVHHGVSPLDGTELLELSLGPQHPSTHGVFRMNAILDGETVVRLQPVFGYLHRNHEQLAEKMFYLGSMPYTDRLDYFCSLTNNWAYAMAVEQLAGLEVPERAEYLRVILAEFTRLQNHAIFLGFLLGDMGAWGSVLMYGFKQRDAILDLFESLTGSRMMCDYMRFGGCRCDLPQGWLEQAKRVVDEFPGFLDEMEKLLVENEILRARTMGIGALDGDRLVNGGITGPMLRAAGVNYDLRKVDRYGIYDRFTFRVPLGEHGDVYDRLMIRILEMRESLKILDQALRDLPDGPILDPLAKLRNFKPPSGEAYARLEAPKGELGFYLISDNSTKPYRYRVRPPSLINLTLLEEMCIGTKIADVMVILGSIDIVLGEVDR